MNPIYVHIIYEYGGEYDDAYETVLAVFYDEDRAKKYLSLMEKQEAQEKEFAYELYKLGDYEGTFHQDRLFRLTSYRVCDWDAEDGEDDNE